MMVILIGMIPAILMRCYVDTDGTVKFRLYIRQRDGLVGMHVRDAPGLSDRDNRVGCNSSFPSSPTYMHRGKIRVMSSVGFGEIIKLAIYL
jgi:hypothetical protein